MPLSRPRSFDLMSRSLNPSLDGTFGSGSLWRSSLASFHLTGKKSMITSVDLLFQNDEKVKNVVNTTAVPDIKERGPLMEPLNL